MKNKIKLRLLKYNISRTEKNISYLKMTDTALKASLKRNIARLVKLEAEMAA